MTQIIEGRKLSLQQTLPVLLFLCYWMAACNNGQQKPPEKILVKKPEQIDVKASELLEESLTYSEANHGMLNDSTQLNRLELLKKVYGDNQYQTLWSEKEKWTPMADSLYHFIYFAKQYGLFPTDYHLHSLMSIRNGFASDTLHRKNAALWAKADILLTNAYFNLAYDLKLGRLPKDSITLRNDSLINNDFFLHNFQQAFDQKNIRSVLEQLEPKYNGYLQLKAVIPGFLDSATFNPVTYIVYPTKDSLGMLKLIEKRLGEAGFDIKPDDKASFKQAVMAYQKQKGITPASGKVGEKTIRSLNNTDWEKFKRIAITLDRYKMLPDTLPHQYIWVNLPAFYMQLWDADTINLQSKVVVGKPETRTPVLTSKLANMVTYPQWTIPTSIIVKEVLPGLKKDTAYLRKKGYSLLDDKGEEVNPRTVNWNKYSKGIPYKVIQGSGDDNALGILKFNFNNKYSVYMHDTNQRYYFKNTMRALSHGCVRVQEWDKLAHFIIRNDSLNSISPATTFKADSLKAWLQRKEKHTIPIRDRIPLYIRYYTCEAKNGKVVFYDDIYGEDRILSEKYFANKPID